MKTKLNYPAQYQTPEYLALLAKVKGMVKDNWSLCEFTGDSESEMMMAQTLHAAAINLKNHGAPFSFRGNSALNGYTAMGGEVDNARGYNKMLRLRYIEELEVSADLFERVSEGCEYGGKTMLLFLTENGLRAMECHVNSHKR